MMWMEGAELGTRAMGWAILREGTGVGQERVSEKNFRYPEQGFQIH